MSEQLRSEPFPSQKRGQWPHRFSRLLDMLWYSFQDIRIMLGRGGKKVYSGFRAKMSVLWCFLFRAPFEAIALYYDPKYGSFENAIGKPAGLVQISNPVLIVSTVSYSELPYCRSEHFSCSRVHSTRPSFHLICSCHRVRLKSPEAQFRFQIYSRFRGSTRYLWTPLTLRTLDPFWMLIREKSSQVR